MITKFVAAFEDRKADLRAKLEATPPEGYIDLVRAVVEILEDPDDPYGTPLTGRIHTINDDGDYQGVMLFVIGGYGDNYWYVKVNYGSCSGCDTFQSIRMYSDEPLTKQQVDDYMTLCLHIVQRLHPMEEEF